MVLFNHGAEDFAVAPGDRVAQMILELGGVTGMFIVDDLRQVGRIKLALQTVGIIRKGHWLRQAVSKHSFYFCGER